MILLTRDVIGSVQIFQLKTDPNRVVFHLFRHIVAATTTTTPWIYFAAINETTPVVLAAVVVTSVENLRERARATLEGRENKISAM